jgi:hypothetical protein
MTRAKQWLRRCGLATLLAVTSATGCTKSTDQVAAQALADPAVQALLRKIPADTPYAIVSFGGSVRPLVEKIYKGMAPLVDKLGPMMDAAPISGESGPLLKAILAEVKGVLQEGGIDRLGIDVDGRYAVYGIGGMPAFRWSLKNPPALRDMFARIQQGGGVTIPTCKLGDVEYWCGGPAEFKVAAAIVGDELVFGVAPTALADRIFGILLGTSAPERSLADSPKLKEIMSRWDLGRFNVGFVDSRVITEAFLGEGDPLNRDVLAALAPDLPARWPQISAVCKDEIRALAGVAPLVVFGTEALGADGFESVIGIELRSDVAADLRALRTSVPGLSKELRQEALFAMGAGADVGKAIELALREAQEVLKSPYQCEHLTGLNRAAEEIAKGASESIPKFVPHIRGGNLVLQELKLSGFLPTTLQGYLVVATTDPRGLYEAIRADQAAVGAYEFSDDGKVRTLPDGTIPLVNGIAYGAQAGRGFALAIGSGSESTVGKLLAAPDVKDPPLAVFAYNLGRIMNDLSPLMQMSGQPDITAMLDVYKMFGPSGYEMYAEDRGLVFRAGMTLQ